jgi:hypothetical protein
MFDSVDHQHGDGAALRFEPKSQLFLHRGEQRRTVDIGGAFVLRAARAAVDELVEGPIQLVVKWAVEMRPVDGRAAHQRRKKTQQLRKGRIPRGRGACRLEACGGASVPIASSTPPVRNRDAALYNSRSVDEIGSLAARTAGSRPPMSPMTRAYQSPGREAFLQVCHVV